MLSHQGKYAALTAVFISLQLTSNNPWNPRFLFSMQTIQARSGVLPDNLQEIMDASVSARQALLGGQQQYETPVRFAEFFAGLMPSRFATVVFDPQCAKGNLFSGTYTNHKCGFEIDNRFYNANDSIRRVIGNCVKAWEAMDDLYPSLKFDCQVSNPPFGILWKTDSGNADSTEHTWNNIIKRAAPNGFGYFIANHKTIERLKIHEHPWVYLYQKFPSGVWSNCEVEIGVVHWQNSKLLPDRQHLVYKTLDFSEHAEALAKAKRFFEGRTSDRRVDAAQVLEALDKVQRVLDEEKQKRQPFNIWLQNGKLKTYLSTRTQVKRKLKKEEVLRITRLDNYHPLALGVDRETRKLMENLISCGFYDIQPEAKAAIESALKEVSSLASPILSISDFERVAYADEEDYLVCKNAAGFDFTPGKKYELSTATYSFTETFTRDKVHYDEKQKQTYTAKHECQLSGQDRFIQIKDNAGKVHRFMERPDAKNAFDHDESLLWTIFEQPVVKTIGDLYPEIVQKNIEILRTCELLADYQYYPGQVPYIASVGVKDYGLIGADVGTGKSLMALSLIQLKAPKRALIVAPQGTLRSSEEEDEDESVEVKASQWVQELRRFTPSIPVFELFSYDDYLKIKQLNGGELPCGVYISYFQAMFLNGARERLPDTWDDKRFEQEMGLKLPPRPQDKKENEHYWAESVGKEEDGVRCIVAPCLSTLIADEFDMVCLDEAHICCNLDANVTQMLIRMQPKYRYAFSATPIPNIVSNLFSIMGWLCVPEWHKGDRRNAAWPYAREEIGRFNDTFLSKERDWTQEKMNRDANKDWKGKCEKHSPVISSPARLLKLIKPTLAHISKRACNPNYSEPKIVDVRVPMGKQQSALYAHFLNRGNIAGGHALIRARKQMTYLRNICADPAGFIHGGPKVSSNMNPKTMAIMELAREIVQKGDQLTIICARIGQTETLARLFTQAGVSLSRIDSTIPAEEHSYQSNLFKRKERQVNLMGIKCAASHSFSECPYEIVASLEYSPGPLEQAKGRVDRVNSKYPVTIYCILHKHSFEETMFDTVATKQDAATICLLGRRIPRAFKPVDFSEVLAHSMANYKDIGVDERDCEITWSKLCGSF